MKKFSAEYIACLILLYKEGKTTWQVAEAMKCAQSFVINTLKRNNIPRRTNKQYTSTTKYMPDMSFFSTIDTEEKAYFLGLLYADGNIYVTKNKKSNDLEISLQEEDKVILEKFRDMLSPSSLLVFTPKAKDTWKNQYALRISNKELCQQLITLGCVTTKSLVLQYPNKNITTSSNKTFYSRLL